eukprot:g2361.t1
MKLTLVGACAFAALGGILFGMDQGNYSGASQYDSFFETFCVGGGYGSLAECKARSSEKPTAWVNAEAFFAPSLQLGSAAAALFVAPALSRAQGRRCCIFVGALVSLLGMLGVGASRVASAFIAARIVTGVGVGLVTYAVPQYTSELAPRQTRGALSSLFQLATVSGVITATAITLRHSGPWSTPFVVPCAPATLVALFIFRFPESPRWLLQYESEGAALAVLLSLRETQAEAEEELAEMKQALAAAVAPAAPAHASAPRLAPATLTGVANPGEAATMEAAAVVVAAGGGQAAADEQAAMRLAWRAPSVQRRVAIAVFLQMGQQLTGINGFTTLGTQFFRNAGVKDAFFSNFVSSFGSFVGTVLQIRCVDDCGRRPLLLGGMLFMMLAMLGCALMIATHAGAGEAANTAAAVALPEWLGYVMVSLVTLFHFSFGASWGPVCWVYPSEIFPMHVKERAMAHSVTANYVSNIAILLVISKLEAWSHAGTCFVLAAVCLATLVVTYAYVPETKGVGLEQMDALFTLGEGGVNRAVGGAVVAKGTYQQVSRDSMSVQ